MTFNRKYHYDSKGNITGWEDDPQADARDREAYAQIARWMESDPAYVERTTQPASLPWPSATPERARRSAQGPTVGFFWSCAALIAVTFLVLAWVIAGPPLGLLAAGAWLTLAWIAAR